MNKRVRIEIFLLLILFFSLFLTKSIREEKRFPFNIFESRRDKFSSAGKFIQGADKEPLDTIKAGERLHFGIYLAKIKVGDAYFTYLGKKEINGVKVDCISLEAKAPTYFEEQKILGNIDDFSPIRVERKIQLLGEDISIAEDYDLAKNEVIITRKSLKLDKKIIKSQGRLNNVVLLLYYLRLKGQLKIGEKLTFNLPTKRLNMVVKKEVEIKVPKGIFDSFYIESIPSHFKVWILKDADGLPLRIQGAIGFGNTHLELIDRVLAE